MPSNRNTVAGEPDRREFLMSSSGAILGAGWLSRPALAATPPNPTNLKRKSMRGQIIDVHAHAVLPVWLDALSRTMGVPRDKVQIGGTDLPEWTPEHHIEVMDAHGIASTVLSWPGATFFLRGKAASDLARAMNEELAKIVARYPDRFGAFAVLPTDDMDATLSEMAYALDVLKLDGLSTGTNIAGVYLGDPSFDPWFDEMNRRKAVLFVHPSVPADNAKVGLGINVSMIEFMFDTTRMATNMVFTGAKRRFSDVAVISSHGGGTVPYLASRVSLLEGMYGTGGGREPLTEQEVLDGFASFYFDLTAATSPAQMDAMLHLVPSSRLMLGFDYPLMPERLIDAQAEPFAHYAALKPQQREDIVHGTARTLFPRFAARVAA